jgi:hypothetical protein
VPIPIPPQIGPSFVFDIYNDGNVTSGPLAISIGAGNIIPGSDFTVTAETVSGVRAPPNHVLAGTVTIQFAPTFGSAGDESALVTVSDTDTTQTSTQANITVLGTAPYVQLRASPASFDFGPVRAEDPVAHTATFNIFNDGNIPSGPLNVPIGNLSNTDFIVTAASVNGASAPPNGGMAPGTVTIQFAPSGGVTGQESGTTSVVDTDTTHVDFPANISVTGFSAFVNLLIQPVGPFANLCSGTTCNYGVITPGVSEGPITFEVFNEGNITSNILTVIGLPASHFILVNDSLVQAGPNGGSGGSFAVTYAPSSNATPGEVDSVEVLVGEDSPFGQQNSTPVFVNGTVGFAR